MHPLWNGTIFNPSLICSCDQQSGLVKTSKPAANGLSVANCFTGELEEVLNKRRISKSFEKCSMEENRLNQSPTATSLGKES